MKNFVKKFLLIAVVIGLIFSIMNCKNNEEPQEPKSPNKIKGDTLTLTGQVQTMEPEMSGFSLNYKNFTGDLNLADINGKTGTIKKGKLSFVTEKPDAASLMEINDYVNELEVSYDSVTVSNSEAKVYLFGGFEVNDEDFTSLVYSDINLNFLSLAATAETVSYIWADRAVRITGNEKKIIEDNVTITNKKLDVSLKPGWNPLYAKAKGTMGFNGSFSVTNTLYVQNLKLRWVLYSKDILDELPDYPIFNLLEVVKTASAR